MQYDGGEMRVIRRVGKALGFKTDSTATRICSAVHPCEAR